MLLSSKRRWWLSSRPMRLTSNRLSGKRCPSTSNTSRRSTPTLRNINRQLQSCRDKCRHSRFLWPAKGICLQWVWLKKVWTWGMKFLTMSQALSTQTGTQQFTNHLTRPFHFRSTSDLGTGLSSLIWSRMFAGSGAPTSPPPQLPPHSSTLFHGVSQVLLNRTFDVSGIQPTNLGNAQDAATITAEDLAAAAAQASKEFWRMREPKITKLHGGYSADAELMFWSWQVDILANIQDRELDNKVAIQLIKEQTLDNARHEVKFQLDLCGGNITYQNLLRYLSITFQGGNDEANLLAEFYSRGQKLKESEEAFADELQILTCKVIIKKPDFRVNLDMTLKQRYASQLFDCNSTSIAKTFLVQMQQCSFTEFCNELDRVLGTC